MIAIKPLVVAYAILGTPILVEAIRYFKRDLGIAASTSIDVQKYFLFISGMVIICANFSTDQSIFDTICPIAIFIFELRFFKRQKITFAESKISSIIVMTAITSIAAAAQLT